MKRTILILIFGFLVQVATGQERKDSTYFPLDSTSLPVKPKPEKYNWKRAGIAAGISAGSGFMWGLHQVLSHRPFSVFQRAFPSANEQFWNPSISWTNKYIGHDPENGRNGKPIWITDGSHLLASGNQTTIFAAGAVVTIGKRRPLWHYAADITGSFIGYNFGNWIGWRGLYW